MKKIVGLIITVMMVMAMLVTASANNDEIWDNVYDYWKHIYEDEYKLFIETQYASDGFVNDNIAYYASSNCAIYYDEKHSLEEMKENLNESCEGIGLKHYSCTVRIIGNDDYGRNVIYIAVNTMEDLTKIDGANCNLEGPIYGFRLVCYDKICKDY